jgi:hypothetical protein
MAMDPLSLWYVVAQGRIQIRVVLPVSHDKLTDPQWLMGLGSRKVSMSGRVGGFETDIA